MHTDARTQASNQSDFSGPFWTSINIYIYLLTTHTHKHKTNTVLPFGLGILSELLSRHLLQRPHGLGLGTDALSSLLAGSGDHRCLCLWQDGLELVQLADQLLDDLLLLLHQPLQLSDLLVLGVQQLLHLLKASHVAQRDVVELGCKVLEGSKFPN